MLLTSLKALWKFHYEVETLARFSVCCWLNWLWNILSTIQGCTNYRVKMIKLLMRLKYGKFYLPPPPPATSHHQNNSSKKHATRILTFRCTKFRHEIEIEAGNFSRKFSFTQLLSWLSTYALIFHRHDLCIISRYLTPTMLQIFFYSFRSVVVPSSIFDMLYKIVCAHKSQLTNQHKRMKNVFLLSARHWMSHLLPK